MPLERAVRELLPTVEKLAGEKAKIRWNKHNDKAPQPRSAAATVIVKILAAFPKSSNTASILNMIEKVHNNPEIASDNMDANRSSHKR